MRKIRVYEYAKEQNITSKDVITYLKENNIEVSNHMSTIDHDTIKKLDQKFGKKQGDHTPNTTQKQNSENTTAKNET
ncbi:translation initiation factor IF-2 N-terminal domain-containing protein [Ornithinibacillus scapharcae]|uniref:translation initiation factor IF-2 N-terminal domain-containing protein n=1 Tax=Ornithinibacillus scapharcae TaxID=1147159 RepID=UPI000225B538